jgi:hypothetical protein
MTIAKTAANLANTKRVFIHVTILAATIIVGILIFV